MTNVLSGRITEPGQEEQQDHRAREDERRDDRGVVHEAPLEVDELGARPTDATRAVIVRGDRADRARGVLGTRAERLVHGSRLKESQAVAHRLRPRHRAHALEPADLLAHPLGLAPRGTVAVIGESTFGVNSSSIVSVTVRASRPSGTDWLPGWTRTARAMGRAAIASTTVTPTATGTGRRMTARASRNQRPVPGGGGGDWRRLRAFTRSPSSASIAGVANSAPAAASSETVAAPAPIE